MGLFGSPALNYSADEHPISAIEIKKLVSKLNVPSLDQNEEHIVEELIIARRHADGKISMRQIYEVLLKLDNQNKISTVDRKGLMEVFEEFFSSHS